MSLPKFISLLQKRSLFLSRAVYFEDPFEGSTAKKNIDFRETIKTHRKIVPELSSYKDLSDEELNAIFSVMKQMNERGREEMMVSCWHMNEHESAAMWKLYSRGEPIVSIQTNFDILQRVLPNWIYVGKVKYIDYQKEYIREDNGYYNIMHKRKSFEHEQEVRAVACDHHWPEGLYKKEQTKFGIEVPIEIEQLIEAVYIDPIAPDWFHEVTGNICHQYSLTKPIKSVLSEKPLY